MSRHRIPLEDGRCLIVGWDRSASSFFGQVWTDVDAEDLGIGPPIFCVGYDDEERQLPPLALEYGPWPVQDPDELAALLRDRASVDLLPKMQTQLTVDKALSR